MTQVEKVINEAMKVAISKTWISKKVKSLIRAKRSKN